MGRAGCLAAAALGAREAVEKVLPAEVLEAAQPERGRARRHIGLCRLEVHRRQLTARCELAEEDVRQARGDMEVFAERQVDEERRHDPDVGPPAHGVRGLQHRR